MEISELLKQATGVIRDYSDAVTQEEKTASVPEYYLDMDELRSLANGK